MTPHRVIFLGRNNTVIYEDETDSRGHFDSEKAALQLLLRGIQTEEKIKKVRVFAEEKNDGVVANIWKIMKRLKTELNEASVGRMSARQSAVCEMICNQAYTNKEIGSILNITERTVKYHVSALLRKYGVRDRRELSMRMRGRFFENRRNGNGPSSDNGHGGSRSLVAAGVDESLCPS